jgi:hypothetical protein
LARSLQGVRTDLTPIKKRRRATRAATNVKEDWRK